MTTGRRIVAMLLVACCAATAFLLLRSCDETIEVPRATRTAPAPPRPDDAPPRAADVARKGALRPAEPTPDPAAPKSGTLVVLVTSDERDAPVAGATVVATGPVDARDERATDAEGVARFGRLAAGSWTVYATAPGWMARRQDVGIENARETRLELRMTSVIVLQVRVEERRNGSPIADAKIEIDVVGSDAKDTATSGDDGERVVLEPANSILRVTATARGFSAATEPVRTGAPGDRAAPVVLRLSPLGRLTGVVRAPDGDVVMKAVVTVASQASPGLRPLLKATTNAEGRFAVEGLSTAVRYRAFADRLGGAWAPSETAEGLVLSPDLPAIEHDFTLRECGTVVVCAKDANGSPVADAMLILTEASDVRSEDADGPGVWHVERRPPGPLGILVRAKSGSAARNIDVEAGGTQEVELVIGTAPTVNCVVVDDDGRPVPGAKLALVTSIGSVAFDTELLTGNDGTAALPVVAMGRRSLRVTAAGMTDASVDLASVTSDVRVVMRRAAVLTFRLRNGGDSMVRLVFGDESSASNAPTAADGGVRYECAPRDSVELRIYAGTAAPVVRTVRLLAGEVTDLGEMTLVPARRLRARVIDAAGRPVVGATIDRDAGDRAVRGTPSSGESFIDPSTDWEDAEKTRGEFDIEFAPPSGPMHIRVRADGYVALRRTVLVEGDSSITLELERGGLVWGEIVGAGDLPMSNATLRIVDARGSETTVTSDERGAFGIGCPPGHHVVRADGCDDVDVDVREGGDTHVRLVAR